MQEYNKKYVIGGVVAINEIIVLESKLAPLKTKLHTKQQSKGGSI